MDDNRSMNIDVIMRDPAFVELAMKVMEMEPDIDEDYLVPFEPDEDDEDTGVKIVKTRQGDYGQEISYVPSRYIKKRVDLAFKQKWSFFIVAERREIEPFQRWSKQENDYVDGSNYLRCIGMMVVPGLGIRMEYGVKKVFGDAESSDWKACKTDAFKKCAEAFGIYLNYEDNDDDDEESGGRRGRSNGKGGKVDLSDVEYSDDDLDDAFSEELGFGKYKGSTLQEIYEDEEDVSYIEWLAENARDDDMRFYASVILKYNEDQEEEKSNHRRNKSKSGNKSGNGRSGKSSSSGRGKGKSKNYMNPPEDDDDDEEEESGGRSGRGNSRRSSSSKGSNKSGRSRKSDDDEEDEKATLIEGCRAVLDEYDRVQAKSVMASVTTSNKYPRGKSKLDQFTVEELRELADVLEV